MIKRIVAVTALAAVLAAPAFANDGFGGLTATGLQFDQTGVVQMLSEDLYLSLEKIKVAYVFRHSGDEDLTGEVIFPLPPINLGSINESDFAIDREQLDKENIVNFTATVDGKAVAVKTDRIAVMEAPYGETEPPASRGYNDPGTDITAVLTKYKIPLSLDFAKVSAALVKLPQAAKDDLTKLGYAGFDDNGGYPLWSIIERYHWTQTFPHGKDVKIAHSYDGAFPGGIFIWKGKPTSDDTWQAELTKKYCIDTGTGKAILNALRLEGEGADQYSVGTAYYVDYVLTTANTWAGPIGDFKLTIDKGNAKNVISLCVDGIKKTGPTTFVVEKKNFTPASDISILLIPDKSTMPQ
ncbi:hypothetical protein sos41_01150 [Alphaproteobacteria bacterium SO-S41]|nr:hypothetical protein sos41_01150 [Alphaproteobacteria bacterium SO-S41]